FRFQLLENRPSPLDRELLDNLELVLFEVDIAPAEGEHLAPTETGDETEMEGREQTVLGGDPKELTSLVEGPPQLLTGPVRPRRLRQRHGIRRHPAALDRLLQCHRQDLPHEAGR